MSKLRVAPDLALPYQAVTETFAVLGKRGSGKTYTAGVLVEEMIKAGFHVVVIDPTDAWWGLRSSADGKSPGLPVVIFGGSHADLPLEERDGEVIARAIVEQSITCVLSIRHLKKKARNRFLAGLLEELYHLKANRRDPLHLVVDEADRAAPQKLVKGEEQERVLGAIDEIVRMGRNSGFGCTLITQRSAVISKDVLSQTEVLVTTRTISPQDLAAVDAWIVHHDVEEKRDEFLASLPSLPQGDSWWWSPGWLSVFKHTRVREKETFDSSYTPKPGEKARAPRRMADVDLAKLKEQLAQTIEKAKADDPVELKRKIATLERELRARPARIVEKSVPDEAAMQRAVDRAVATAVRDAEGRWKDSLRTITSNLRSVSRFTDEIARSTAGMRDVVARALEAAEHAGNGVRGTPRASTSDEGPKERERPAATPRPAPASPSFAPRRQPAVVRPGDADGKLGKGERATLTAIAQYPEGADREQLTILTGYKRSTRNAYIQRLQVAGLVVEQPDGSLMATDAGYEALGPEFEPLPTGAALRDYWLNRLGGGEQKILAALIDAYPNAVDREQISEAAGYARSSRNAYIQRLAARKLVDVVGAGQVRASAVLFDEARV